MAFNKKISNFLTEFVKKGPKFSKTGTLTGSQFLEGGDFFQGVYMVQVSQSFQESPNYWSFLPISWIQN